MHDQNYKVTYSCDAIKNIIPNFEVEVEGYKKYYWNGNVTLTLFAANNHSLYYADDINREYAMFDYLDHSMYSEDKEDFFNFLKKDIESPSTTFYYTSESFEEYLAKNREYIRIFAKGL